MAANGVRRALQLSSSSGRILIGRSSATSSGSKIGKSAGIAFANGSSSSPRPSLRRLTFSRSIRSPNPIPKCRKPKTDGSVFNCEIFDYTSTIRVLALNDL